MSLRLFQSFARARSLLVCGVNSSGLYGPQFISAKFCTVSGSTDGGDLEEEIARKVAEFESGMLLQKGRYSGRAWTKEEDERLKQGVEEHGKAWASIAKMVGNDRTNRGCRIRWELTLAGKRNGHEYSEGEIRRIVELSRLYPGEWKKIADLLGTGRTHRQIGEVVMNRLNSDKKHGRWTEIEDERLKAAVERIGVGNWSEIAREVEGRNDAQCYERWSLKLDTGLKRGKWSEEEDRKLVEIVKGLKDCGRAFHFGHVSAMMNHTRHRKGCRERYGRLVKKGFADAL